MIAELQRFGAKVLAHNEGFRLQMYKLSAQFDTDHHRPEGQQGHYRGCLQGPVSRHDNVKHIQVPRDASA